MDSRLLKFFVFVAGFSFFITARAETLKVCTSDSLNTSMKLAPLMGFFEDTKNEKTVEEIIRTDGIFVSADRFKPQQWKSTYWAKFEIENCSDKELLLSLSFKNLTHIELYGFLNGELVEKHSAGLFRSKKEVTPGDHYNYFTLRVKKNEHLTYFLKTNHSKGYKPHLDFSLQDHSSFQIDQNEIVRFDYFIFGAFFIFIIYTLLAFLFNKYRPYFWLGVFTFGMAFYGFTMRGQMLNFFPNHPEFIWRFNSLFTSLSGIGGFMMISTFFNMRKLNPFFHKLLLFLVGVEMVLFITSQLIIFINSNYRLMTIINLIISALFLPVIIYIPMKVWSKLTHPQKIFSVAILFYAGLLVVGLMILFIWKEDGNVVVTYLNNLSGVLAIGFFTISLGEQMRAIEVERNQILIEINQLKNEQNSTLELLVEKRTKELSDANIELLNQKDVLHQRNERIELLLRELHHRVKNNLQLISSFYDLRLEDPVKKDLSSIISEGKNRIGVMALVHNMLYHGNDLTVIDTCSFIHQITAHLETFFNKDQLIETQIICSNLKFDMDTALPLGLIINELLTNTYKHTNFYTERKMVQITIEPTQKHSYKLTISDNGMEIKKKIEPKKTRSFGLQMIYLLSKQLNGSFDYHYDGKNNFIVNFMDTEGRRQIE